MIDDPGFDFEADHVAVTRKFVLFKQGAGEMRFLREPAGEARLVGGREARGLDFLAQRIPLPAS